MWQQPLGTEGVHMPTTPEIAWLSVYDPETGAATKVVGAVAQTCGLCVVHMNPTEAAEPWCDRERNSIEEFANDSNGQTRGVIDAVVDLKKPIEQYALKELAALTALAAVGHGAT